MNSGQAPPLCQASMRSFELFKEGLYQVKLHCEYIVTLLSLHRYLVITIELHVHHFNSQQRYNRGKNGMEKDKRKTENYVTGLGDERGLQQGEEAGGGRRGRGRGRGRR